jgi:hypothetical protein
MGVEASEVLRPPTWFLGQKVNLLSSRVIQGGSQMESSEHWILHSDIHRLQSGLRQRVETSTVREDQKTKDPQRRRTGPPEIHLGKSKSLTKWKFM